ncbi:MAG: helix-turn-helix domain-containing protein [Gaiellaceae bacterium]
MFEIGNSLREARLRQALDFPEIEQATKIRPKYLRALEDEQFDILPGQTYVKGFLRTYSEYLGLDGQLYVDEYNSRYIHVDEETPLRARSASVGRTGPRFESSVVLVALAAIGVVTLLVFAAWRFGSDTPPTAIPDFSTQPPAAAPKPNRAPNPSAGAQRVRMTVTAALGDSWMEVYGGSQSGRLLFRGTVEAGVGKGFLRFGIERAFRRYYVRMGQPQNLRVRVNGRVASLPNRSNAAVVVTANGVRPASS